MQVGVAQFNQSLYSSQSNANSGAWRAEGRRSESGPAHHKDSFFNGKPFCVDWLLDSLVIDYFR